MDFKIKKNDTGKLVKSISIIGGSVMMLLGIIIIILTAPDLSDSGSCGTDGLCNYDCDDKDPDCSSIGQSLGVILLVMAVVIGVGLYSTYQYMTFSKLKSMEEQFPRFMKDFSEGVKGGMTFPQALELTSNIDYGLLSKEIQKTSNQVSWGMPFPKAIQKLGDRIGGSKIMKQSFTVINESYYSGGNVAETMDAIAMNIGTIRELESDRKATMTQQIFIMYFIFILFLGILIVLYKLMTPMMSMQTAGSSNVAGMSLGGGAIDYCSYASPLCSAGALIGFGGKFRYFKSLFFVMCIIQGICTGVLSGVIGEGDPKAGIKHIGIFIVLTVIAFMLVI